jgi:lambda family phage tail tape measure protein
MSIDYTVNVNTSQATANLERLKAGISNLTDKFSGLKSAIAGLAFASGTAAVLEYANGIKDISEVTGIAIANVVGFTKAVSENNGSVEQGQAGLVKLVSAIGQAADGSATMQDAFAQAGVSLNNLRNLSEQEILGKTLKNLAAMNQSSQRLILVNELLGKSFRSVNLQGVANDYDAAVAGADKYTSSIQSAAQLQNNLETAISRFKLALLESLKPMADFVNKLKPEQINQFIDAIIKIGGAVGGLIAVGKALEWVVAIGGTLVSWVALAGRGWTAFKLGLGVLTEGVLQFGRTFVIAFSVLKNYSLPAWIASGTFSELLGAMGETMAMLGKRFAFFFASIIAGTAGLGLMGAGLVKMIPVVGWIVTAITALNYIIKLAFGIDVIDIFLKKLGVAYDKFKAFLGLSPSVDEKKPGGNLPATGAGAGRGGNAALTEEQQAHAEEVRKQIADEAARKAEAARKVADAYAKQRIEIRQASIEFGKYGDELVIAKRRETDLIGLSGEQQDVMSAQADVMKKTKDEVEKLTLAKSKLSEADLRAGLGGEYDTQIAKIKKLGAADEERIKIEIENLHKKQTAENLIQIQLSKRIEMENSLQTLSDDYAKMKLPAIEQKYYDIEAAANAAGKSMIEAEAQRLGRPLSEDEKKPFMASARQGIDDIKKKSKENYDASREWSTGWANAFNEYVDNATNAANYARDIFQSATSGMTDMIVNFAKTGKLEWKSFVNDMLTTLLRSQLQQTIAKVMGGLGGASMGSGGGGLFGGKIIPGFLASGGPAASNRPYIVGENGPELFLPNVSGSVVPNSAMGGGQNVTYNISAVDARSFQALVAQDPSFIHAVAMAGARNTPRR